MKSLLLFIALIALTQALPKLHVKGSKFFDSTGKQFFVVGLDYAPGKSKDPIADLDSLRRDLPYLTGLGINTIRVYSADASLNHDTGMKLLNDAGIYVLFDATDVDFSINPRDPSWTLDIFNGMKAKVDALRGYDNVFGFLAGNEVIIDGWADTIAAPYVKAAVRDLKAYLKSVGSSALVGYAATDIDANVPLQQYMDCLSVDTSIDFYGINTYRWCNGDSYQTSNYQFFNKPYDAPVLFTEYGCNRQQPREFNEVQAIFGIMNRTLSGGFAFEYSQEENSFGLVTISGSTVTVLGDYTNLQSQIKNLNLAAISMKESDYNADTTAVLPCPQKNNQFLAASNPLPAKADSTYCQCMMDTLRCTVKSSASPANIRQATSTACGSVSCSGIVSDPKTPAYGDFSACTSIQKSSWALNQYYLANYQSQGANACNFGGVGQVITNPKGCSAISSSPLAVTKSSSASQSASVSSSQSVSASQSQSASQTVSASSIVVDAENKTVSASASVSQTASKTATVSQSESKSASMTESVSGTFGSVNRYQPEWDAAFENSSSTTTPALVVMLVAAVLLVIQ